MKSRLAFKAIRNTLLSAIILLPLQANVGLLPTVEHDSNMDTIAYESDVPPSATPRVVLLDIKEEYCDTECYLKKNADTVEFLSQTFGIDSSHIYADLIETNKDMPYVENNIGLLKDSNGNLYEYNSFERGLIEYLYKFANANPRLVDNTRVPYKGKSDYVLNLIKYFTKIYDNVDYLTAVSIGAAESGYYQVKYMLESNNVYGGMTSNHTLIKHKNIEYGVLSYIRLLSRNYYGKGLNTLESIGRVYCPVFDEAGNKIARPHWINLVNTAKSKYAGTYTDITIEELTND